MPFVSIIIATSGRPKALEETLYSLATIRLNADWLVELLLVENGSRAGVEHLLGVLPDNLFSSVRYLFEPASGKSRALNLALTHARGEILLFSDDDVRFPSDWVGRMCEPIVSGSADAVAGGVKLAPHLLRPWMTRTHRAWLASTADYLSANDPSEICGANTAIHRRVFDQVSGFDPELGPGITGGGEESLFSWQIRKAGFRIVGALDVEVEHHPNPERLRYRSWLEAARQRGLVRAYHLRHWYHEPVPLVHLRKWWLTTKLSLRRWCSLKRRPEDEGISPWELSYVEELSIYESYLRERNRARNYSRQGLRKLCAVSQPISA